MQNGEHLSIIGIIQFLTLRHNRNKNIIEGKFYRINDQIRADEIRIIDAQGKQVGIFSRSQALEKAQETELDLIEVAPEAKPPVVKLVDLAKFKYDQAKKKKSAKASVIETKTIRLRPFMNEHDVLVRVNKIKNFIKDGDRVKLQIQMFGREITKKDFAFKLIDKVMAELREEAHLANEPALKGKIIETTIVPK